MARTATAAPETVSGEVVVQTIIENTKGLIEAKRDAVKAVAEARNMLHSFVTQGLANPDQVAWIDENLPRKTRNTSENGEVAAEDEDE